MTLFPTEEVIFVEDQKQGGYTVFFKEIPNVVSEGETKEEAFHNLILTLHDIVMVASNSIYRSYPAF